MTTISGNSDQRNGSGHGRWRRGVSALGAPVVAALFYVGGLARLSRESWLWVWRSAAMRSVRFGRFALYAQIVRIGPRAVGVIVLVNFCIGLIMVLQMAPTLDKYGQTEQVATVNAIAIIRELGPLLSAIVLTGFAGASIAAELGTMVVGEEVDALQAHALNPVRFLVVPRLIATTLCLLILCVMGELVAISAGYFVGVHFLDIQSSVYITNTLDSLDLADLFTGLTKAGVFGILIALIACYNGLSVTGGAAGVGKATTNTVVHSIVAIIFTDLLFTALFYRLGWT